MCACSILDFKQATTTLVGFSASGLATFVAILATIVLQMNRVKGLDSIRAICAFWVVMGHVGGPPFTAGIDRTTWAGWIVNGFLNNIWNGPAAVIVFFVISGFCIHYPFSFTDRHFSFSEHIARRYIRIGIPFIVAIAISHYLGVQLSVFHDGILWSLIAELVYYGLYPALLTLRRRGFSWRSMCMWSFASAIALAATQPGAKNYPSWGMSFNWLLGLPCWILGCGIAEQIRSATLPNPGRIWVWRFAIWVISVVLSVLRFHSPLGYPWTLNVFGIMIAYWLIREISLYREQHPPRLLEWVGKWSYSIYLVHIPAHAAFSVFSIPNLGYAINWVLQTSFILGCSYLFYVLIEYPGHVAAKWITRGFARQQNVRHSELVKAPPPAMPNHPSATSV